jgi:hypothetical protein
MYCIGIKKVKRWWREREKKIRIIVKGIFHLKKEYSYIISSKNQERKSK